MDLERHKKPKSSSSIQFGIVLVLRKGREQARLHKRAFERMKQPTGDMIPGLEHAFDEEEERMIRRHREMAFAEIEEEEDIAGVVNSGFSSEMMEVDDRDDPVDVLGDLDKHLHPVDSDFFNSFADDFDDTDLS